MAEADRRRMTVEEFYLWCLDQEERWELVDGVPVRLRGMTGASHRHDIVVVNAIGEFREKLRGRPCRATTADTALRTSIRTTRRPDLMIECAPPEINAYEAREPLLVLEVLSPSTRTLDRIKKLDEYKLIRSLRYVLIVEPGSIEGVFSVRQDDGSWVSRTLTGPDALIDVPEVGISLPLGALYEGVPLDPPAQPS
jgi:Uma2 family endonuclease